MPKTFLSIIIPIYNEAESIRQLHAEIASVMHSLPHKYEIIFVDDGSSDGSINILSTLTQVRVLSFTRNFGKSQALQAGFDYANGDYVLTMDGDLQDDPKEIPRFIAKAKDGYDLVCGWKKRRKDALSRKIISAIANFVTRQTTGTGVQDMNCCFKIYRREVIKNLELYGDMHRYIPAIVSSMGYTIGEISVNHRTRVYGKSKYGFSRILNGLFDFITLYFLRKFTDRPMYLFGGFGLVFSGFGFLILLYLSWIKIFQTALIGNRPLLLLGALLFIVGLQFFSLGFIGELLIRKTSIGKRDFIIRKTVFNDENKVY